MDDLQKLLCVFDAYVTATGSAEATVSARFLQRGGRIADLRTGGDMGSRTIQRALRAFSAQWPEGAAWPEGVARPELAEAAIAEAGPVERSPVEPSRAIIDLADGKDAA